MSNIVVVGLGYVGAVSLACLAELGHTVAAVDIDRRKVDAVHDGRSPVSEPGLEELLARNLEAGRASATTAIDPELLHGADAVFVSVGTPSLENGGPDLRAVARVGEQLGRALAEQPGDGPLIVLRSTVPPGTTLGAFRVAISSGYGSDFPEEQLCYNPEFLREGSALEDFFAPPKTVVGSVEGAALERVLAVYDGVSGPVFTTDIATAEYVKYMDNSFHALKVAFANEMARVGAALGADVDAAFEVFLADTKLNASAAYLRPGFAFGGSCLPKDVRAVARLARNEEIDTPLLQSILPSNDAMIDDVRAALTRLDVKRLLIVGLAFKEATDDVRSSPYLALAEFALGKGIEVCAVDPDIAKSRLHGANLLAALGGNQSVWDSLRDEPGELGHFDFTVMSKSSSEPWRWTTDVLVDATVTGLGERLRGRTDVVLRPWDLPGFER